MKSKIIITIAVAGCMATVACGQRASGGEAQATADSAYVQDRNATPEFSGDSAMALVDRQCEFGPRVPGTEAHRLCSRWLHEQLKERATSAEVLTGQVTTFDGTVLTARNHFARINPEAKTRILLLAHWDCRPWADEDPDEAKRRQPVMGANDGASGVAVILELARMLKAVPPKVGVDILLVDVEDWGTDNNESSWALGTQLWVKQQRPADYQPQAAVLLDMVGDSRAQFRQEQFSLHYAPQIVDQIWRAAQQTNYGSLFIGQPGGAVTDDHIPLNRAGIPTVDIIDMRMDSPTGFPTTWHTTHDTPDALSPLPMQAVGATLLKWIYSLEAQ